MSKAGAKWHDKNSSNLAKAGFTAGEIKKIAAHVANRNRRADLHFKVSVDAAKVLLRKAFAELAMGKSTGCPVAIVRGGPDDWFGESSIREDLVRDAADDLFR